MSQKGDRFKSDSDEVSGKAFDVRLVRRMLGYVRPYRSAFVLSVFLSTFAVVLDLLIAEIVKDVIDGPLATVVTRGDAVSEASALDELVATLGLWAGIMVGIILLGGVIRIVQIRVVNRVAQKSMRDLRVQVFSHVQQQSLRFFDRNPVGRLVTRAVHDVEALSDLLTSGLDAFFHDVFLLVGIFIWLMVIDWRLTLATFVVLPLLMVVTQVFRNWSRRSFRQVRERVARVNSTLQESIQGMRVIQAFVQERKIQRRFEQQNRALADGHQSTVQNFALFFPATEFVSALGKAMLLWWAAGSVVGGALSFGELVQFIFYLELFFRPIRDLSEKFNILQGSMASAERLFQLLDRESDLVSPATALVPERLSGSITFESVDFAYQEGQPVLTDISFDVRAGETIALVGATGAGKTTVASLVTRLYDVNKGRVLVDGVDVREYELTSLRRGITVVPQDVFLFAGTIEDNLRMGDLSLTREHLLDACKATGADRILDRLPAGLDSPVAERGAAFSVGERQLLAMARALAQDPAVLVLDEATSSVDSETEHLIQQALERLQEGRTTLVIAHRLSTIRRCDRILVFHHGRLREQGSHAELIAQDGIYATLHRLQFAA